eukprot:8338322-Pyramimonas_sp.AAC.1
MTARVMMGRVGRRMRMIRQLIKEMWMMGVVRELLLGTMLRTLPPCPRPHCRPQRVRYRIMVAAVFLRCDHACA